MKKFIVNVIVFILCYFIVDFYIYQLNCNEYKKFTNTDIYPIMSYSKFYTKNLNFSLSKLKEICNQSDFNFFRKNPANSNLNTKPAVLLFGCSFTYGTLLEDKQTLHYKLSKLTKRNVYNRSLQSCGIQHMYFFLSDKNFFNTITTTRTQYAIYVYIPSHLQRLTTHIFPNSLGLNGNILTYKLKNNDLITNNTPSFLYRSFIFKELVKINDKRNNTFTLENNYKKFILANEMFLRSKKILEEKYPDIKFVILKYSFENDNDVNYELPFMWDILEKEGFIILDTKDLIGRKFVLNSKDTVKDGYHPSEYAWDLIIPPLIKKLNL